MKLPKSIIKKHGITKKAWEVFRGTKSKKSKKAKKVKYKVHRRKSRIVVAKAVESVKKVVARKRRSIMPKGKRKHHKGRGAIKSAIGSRPGQVVAMAATAAAGGMASSIIVNKAPVIKDQGRLAKAALQGGLGLVAIMFIRSKMVKSLGAGAVIAGVMSAAQEIFKVNPLAGPTAGSRRLTPTEMAQLSSGQMAMPLPGQTMAMPLSNAPMNAGFNRAGFGK